MPTHNHNCNALRNRFKCPYCTKGFMMDWALENHKKVCPYRDDDEDNKHA